MIPHDAQKTADTGSTTHARSDLKIRLISAAVGIPIISALVIAAALVAGFEISAMAKAQGLERLRYIAFVVVPVVFGVTNATAGTGVTVAVLIAGLVIIVVGQLLAYKRLLANPRLFLTFTLAAFYFGACLAHAPLLVELEDGRSWILLAILGTFAVDTGAYFTGRSIGRHLLAPAISPKKTWEGVGGGMLAGVGAIIGLGAVLDLPISTVEAGLLGIALAASGVAGDLVESWLKRRANVKDSGMLIPGHGGILDRVDSLAPNLAVVYWATQLIGI
jgi:phosphatidate cytidylyltransferase